MHIRDIVFSLAEPRKDALWIGRKSDGSYFAKVWNNGWYTVAGSDSVSIKDVEQIVGKSADELKLYFDEAHVEMTVSEIDDIWNCI